MEFKIGNRQIGENSSVFVIAEISANHNQKLADAIKLIKAAKRVGADAVKFQTYTPDTLTVDMNSKYFKIKHPEWGGQTLYQLYSKAYTPWEWFKNLKKVADEEDIIFFSTAFDKSSVDFLEELSVPAHKVASCELVDLPLIEYMAKTKKPIIMSTGVSTFSEIKDAVSMAKKKGVKDLALLKCVSSYPADPKEMNLRTITDMQRRFKVPIGLSDHTLGVATSVAAISLGACIIEKHLTLSGNKKTPDGFFSLEPQEFKQLVDNIRIVEKALGSESYDLTPGQKKNRIFRRSLFVVEDIKKGEVFTEKNVRSIRPAHGMEPKYLNKVIGKKAAKTIKRGMPFKWDYIA